jgi:hypothetical protein
LRHVSRPAKRGSRGSRIGHSGAPADDLECLAGDGVQSRRFRGDDRGRGQCGRLGDPSGAVGSVAGQRVDPRIAGTPGPVEVGASPIPAGHGHRRPRQI